ncbi:ATP-binding domain-containing protein [Vibrio parahaemolyticus]|nr:ATP-binding domain-containing protein [Vibrio parahaemolyticus]
MIGPSVQEYSIEANDVEGSLSEIILRQIGRGYKRSEITVLSPRDYNDSVINRLPKEILNQVVQLDDYKMKSFPPREISFSTIDNFQGLENKCIVLIDVSNELFASEPQVAYVGMTRASEQLCIVSSDIDFVINTDLEDDSGWQVILENTFLVNEAESFREQSLLVPMLGFELVHAQSVVAMAEFAWPEYKIAVFEPEELDAKEAFSQFGWKCYFAPIDATALQEISLSVNATPS